MTIRALPMIALALFAASCCDANCIEDVTLSITSRAPLPAGRYELRVTTVDAEWELECTVPPPSGMPGCLFVTHPPSHATLPNHGVQRSANEFVVGIGAVPKQFDLEVLVDGVARYHSSISPPLEKVEVCSAKCLAAEVAVVLPDAAP